MPQTHPLTRHKVITADNLRSTQMVSLRNYDQERLNIEMVMEEVSPHSSRSIETFSSNVACELVRHGVGVGLIDALTAVDSTEKGLTFRSFEPSMSMDLCVITPEHWALPLIAQDLVDFLQDKAKTMQERLQNC
jgi:DNA-binding transcriptional LysR family regulator